MATDRKSIISAEWDIPSATLTFNVLGGGQLVLDVARCGETVVQRAAFHGFEQKVRDAGAIPRDTNTGRSATPAEKFAAMKKVVENLHAGEWNVRASSVRPLDRASLFAAIATVRGFAPEKVYAKLQQLADEVLRAFLTHRDIVAEYSRLTAPSAGSEAADALLGEMEE